ncbi:heparanase [Betta splendens]|uniref:Heparanase n=1 Tax=Betta splendens TaxID=158456 RepID=A0A6P7P2A8_BETSP|nr:heparanase [Betta splendens]
MEHGALLVLCVLCFQTGTVYTGADPNRIRNCSGSPDVSVDLDLSEPVRRVEPRFLSVTVDASLAQEEAFMYLLSSVKIRTLAKALSPAFLRFGGTRQDFMVFSPRRIHQDPGIATEPSCAEGELPSWLEEKLKTAWVRQQEVLLTGDLQRKYKAFNFTETTVDLLNTFSSCSGLDLVFGLNALLRTADNSWDNSNARSLLQYCESRRYRMSWELGNEPNSFEKKAGIRVDGEQLGRDFTHLRQLMSESKLYQDARLYGPDVGQLRDHRVDVLTGFLSSGAAAVNACTWHHYYVNGRTASLEDFLDPKVLDSLAVETSRVFQEVNRASPGKSVWLGETSSACGGGAAGLSDTFVAGFMWLDKLGLGAQLGLDVVMRQVLVGSGSYHMIDENLDPLPDYWLSVLYKALVGPEVLRIKAHEHSSRVRLYLHCSNPRSYRRGAVTLMSLNLGREAAWVQLPASISSSAVEAFVLQSEPPGRAGLCSRSVALNGQLLKMLDDRHLPVLRGAALPPAQRLSLPAYSLAFFVFREAGAAACRNR